MGKSEDIAKAFEERGITLVGTVVRDRGADRHLVFVTVDVDDAGAQTPTNHSIARVERRIEAEFGNITVVLVHRGNEDIASSIKSLLIRRYPDQIRNVFSSVDRDLVSVWVEPKTATTKEMSEEMRDLVAGLIEHFQLELLDFINTTELNLPSETACIGALRRMAPIVVPDLLVELENLGFEVPGEEWLVRILDRWRKKSLIHRKSNGQFVLTVRGLRALGSGKNRRSPDVGRALEMARRAH